MKTQKRRKIERKTDYKARLILLKSDLPRIAVRKTNNYIIAQYIKSHEGQDKVVAGVTSKELLNYGWDKKFTGSLKSIPAAYLTGKLLGNKIREKKGKEAILDIGLAKNIAGSRIYAVLKGLIDADIKIPCDEKSFPSEERISGKHLKDDIQKMIEKVREKIK